MSQAKPTVLCWDMASVKSININNRRVYLISNFFLKLKIKKFSSEFTKLEAAGQENQTLLPWLEIGRGPASPPPACFEDF